MSGSLDTCMDGDEEAVTHGWFPCPTCDLIVTGLVRGTGPENTEEICRDHCCFECGHGRGHSFWCAGTPKHLFCKVELPLADPAAPRLAAHCLVIPPAAGRSRPAPALLWLHGAATYTWPETLCKDVMAFVGSNLAAKTFAVVAPFATTGEPLAQVSEWRRKPDRFKNDRPYVETFDVDRTWECFMGACRQLGEGVVDFDRLCATGFSMGGQATWNLAIRHGSKLAAIAPMAGSCSWPGDCWANEAGILDEVRHLPVRAYSMYADSGSFAWRDFIWLAKHRGLPREAMVSKGSIPKDGSEARKCWRTGPDEVEHHRWALPPERPAPGAAGAAAFVPDLQLSLLMGGTEEHNCWDVVYGQEDTFGLLRWMASCRRYGAQAALN